MITDAATQMEKEPGDTDPTADDAERWPIWLIGVMNRRLAQHRVAERPGDNRRSYEAEALYADVRS